MRRVMTTALAILLAGAFCCAQPGRAARPTPNPNMKFETDIYDFGEIKETGGKITTTFTFTNTGNTPVVIERLIKGCGCTATKYERKPVMPGKKGVIEVTFDPNNQPGSVTKRITVITNEGKNANELAITGTVIGRPRPVEESYPFVVGGALRSDAMQKGFGFIAKGHSKSEGIELINTSKKPVSVKIVSQSESGYLRVEVPAKIAPGEKAAMTLTYDLSGKAAVYGMITDRFCLMVDGVKSELTFTCNAIGIDDFGEKDRENAPECLVSPVFHNFGPVAPGEAQGKEFTITNKGKSDLILRGVSLIRASCDLKENTVIKPGQKVSFTVKMTPAKDAYGVVSGSVVIITNDPSRPMRNIRVTAEVRE